MSASSSFPGREVHASSLRGYLVKSVGVDTRFFGALCRGLIAAILGHRGWHRPCTGPAVWAQAAHCSMIPSWLQ